MAFLPMDLAVVTDRVLVEDLTLSKDPGDTMCPLLLTFMLDSIPTRASSWEAAAGIRSAFSGI